MHADCLKYLSAAHLRNRSCSSLFRPRSTLLIFLRGGERLLEALLAAVQAKKHYQPHDVSGDFDLCYGHSRLGAGIPSQTDTLPNVFARCKSTHHRGASPSNLNWPRHSLPAFALEFVPVCSSKNLQVSEVPLQKQSGVLSKSFVPIKGHICNSLDHGMRTHLDAMRFSRTTASRQPCSLFHALFELGPVTALT